MGVDWGLRGIVDTMAVDGVVVLSLSWIGVFVTGKFVSVAVPEAQPASNGIIINPIQNLLIDQIMLGTVWFLNGLLS